MRYLMNITYDGNSFYGYQKQRDKQTVQEEIERCLSKILNQEVNIISASRTDRGVSAYNQYAHFDTDKKIEIDKIKNSLNKMLDGSIYIRKIKKVQNMFHARYDVRLKEYVYKINVGEYNPIEKNYVYQYNKKINVTLLKQAAKYLIGEHDFKTFTSDDTKVSYVRTIKKIRVIKSNNYVYIYIQANGFLRYMIRNIVGLFLEINESKKRVGGIEKLIKNKDRKTLGITAQAHGLYLNKIWY